MDNVGVILRNFVPPSGTSFPQSVDLRLERCQFGTELVDFAHRFRVGRLLRRRADKTRRRGGSGERSREASRRARRAPGKGRQIGEMTSAVSGAKLRKITPTFPITSLVCMAEPPHVVLANNTAKGGDPMSHGSAKGSEKFVRGMRF